MTALFFWSASNASAVTVTAVWDSNSEPNIAGYILSYGTQSGTYSTSIDVGNVTTRQLVLNAGRYYFVVQAYNTSAQVSPRSAEVVADVGVVTQAPNISGLSPTSGSIGTAVTIAGTNFGSTQGGSSVRFNGTAATPTSWSGASIVVPVPSGATTGPVVVTVNGVASNGVTFTVSSSSGVPAPWTSQDVGAPAVVGQATYASGTFSVSAAGVDIWGTTDQFRFVYQPLDGDGTIVARVGSLQNTDPWAKAAVMIREDLTGNAPTAYALVSAGSGMSFQRRATRGSLSEVIQGFTGSAPQWIRVARVGNTLTGSYSADGTTWTVMGSYSVVMPTHVYIGLAVTSHNPSVPTTATFSNVTVTASIPPPNQPPTLTQPANQTSAQGVPVSLQLVASDPNGPPLTYSASGLPPPLSVNPASGLISGTPSSAGTYTPTATVSDGALTNSKTFTWTVTPVSQTPNISGLLPASGSIGTAVTIAGTNFGSSQGGSSVRFNGTAATPTSWSATSIVVPVPSGATTGPVVVTVNGVASNGVTFTVSSSSGVPAPWTTQDVGGPAIAGQATYASGTFTISGAGVDIWDTTDQFRFVYQPLDGDGTIVARVGSLQVTNQWAKVGVMIREDLTGNAPNAIAEVSGSNGMIFQRRATRGGVSQSIQGFSGGAPRWIRVARVGNTLTGSFSSDGTTWTVMGSYTVTMPTRVYIGLAVTSHNPSVTTTATFSNVTVTASIPPPNQPPTLTQPANQTSAQGVPVSLQLVASDPNGPPLTYSASGLPPPLSVNPASGLISGTPSSAGTYTPTATVSDGALTNSKTFTWTVTPVSQTPNISGLLPASGSIGTAVTIAGTNFGSSQGGSSVRFNGTAATPTSWSATSIVVPVPSGATTGPVVVTVNGVASNGVTFTVSSSSGVPAPWTTQDVGGPAIAGQATYASGTFTISGAGVDIWDTTDQFRFVYQPLDGDGTIVARVGSLQVTNQWAKVGVMIREDLTGNAPNAIAEVSGSNGMIFQRRATRGGVSQSIQGFSGGAPRWIRVARVGNTLTGSFSSDGTTWTVMGSYTVTMPTRVYIGLAVTSHNPSVTTTATFSDVTVTSASADSPMSMSMAEADQPAVQSAATAPDQPSAEPSIASPAPHVTPGDYDGDGRADLVAYRRSTGEWRVLRSADQYAAGFVAQWGAPGDLPVPGDYDGDRRTDVAVYRPSTGVWSILTSSSNYTRNVDVVLGAPGDVPAPADFDGDGLTDVAVYTPVTGLWRILQSASGYTTEISSQWGTLLDVPVPGDYDGDGKADLALYRSSTGQWKILQSSTNETANTTIVLGTAGDILAPADYNGDGATDAAVFQPAIGRWVIQLSDRTFQQTVVVTLGAATGVPVPADYDGDGKADLGLFRSGVWQIRLSNMNYTTSMSLPWGSPGDVPLPKHP